MSSSAEVFFAFSRKIVSHCHMKSEETHKEVEKQNILRVGVEPKEKWHMWETVTRAELN